MNFLYIHTDSFLMSHQPYCSPLIHSDLALVIYEHILTYWTNYWQFSPPWWTFYIKSLTPSDDKSATESCISDVMDIFLSNWYSIFNFQYILIDSFRSYFCHKWTHFLTYWTNFWQFQSLTKKYIDRLIDFFWCYIRQTVAHIWP